jgi:hypothetical protein
MLQMIFLFLIEMNLIYNYPNLYCLNSHYRYIFYILKTYINDIFFIKLSKQNTTFMAVKIALSHKTTYTFDRSVKLFPHVFFRSTFSNSHRGYTLKYLQKIIL